MRIMFIRNTCQAAIQDVTTKLINCDYYYSVLRKHDFLDRNIASDIKTFGVLACDCARWVVYTGVLNV